ncbi:ABA4-like family protein [Altererythrobacter sp. CAU 1778]
MWDTLFGAANTLALVAWAALILLPRWEALLTAVLYLGIGLLCMIYATVLVLVLTGVVVTGNAGADFTTIEGVRSIFASDVGVTVGWIHYLAFDLFVGLWIARDGDAKGLSRWLQAPVLAATFIAGPLGLFLWMVIREPAARRLHGRPSRIRR